MDTLSKFQGTLRALTPWYFLNLFTPGPPWNGLQSLSAF